MTIMTIGISILLRETALTIWGEQVQTVPFTGNETIHHRSRRFFFSQLLWIITTAFLIFLFLPFSINSPSRVRL